MDNGNETISIRDFNEKLKSILFSKSLLPIEGKLLKEAKRYYMNLSEGDDSCEGKQVLLTEKDEHVCSPDYLEYYWVEFKYNGKECVVSLFHRDFDGQSGNIHVMPGVLQVWEKKAYDKDKKNPFEKDKGTITFPQSIRSSAGETVYLWNPLIHYEKFSPKQFIWTPYVDINSLKTIIEDVLIKSKLDKTYLNMKFDKPKGLKKFLGDQAKKEVFNLFKRDAIRFKEIGGTSNYQYLFRYTSSSYTFKCCKYFICPYKHIKTDYGYFIRFDGKPIAYKVKYDSGDPNKLNEKTNCFEIGYDYANAVDVINASKGK